MRRLGAAFLFVLAATAPAAGPPAWDGLEQFFAVMRDREIELEPPRRPDILFVLGLPPDEPGPRSFRDYVEKGGTLIVASESDLVNPILEEFGLRIEGSFIRLWARPGSCFKRQVDCPRITAFVRNAVPGLFAGVGSIATNKAKRMAGGGTPLASYPDAYPWSTILGGRGGTFARLVERGEGRLIAIGDQSIFINLMLVEEQNERFLRNLLVVASARSARVFLDGMPIHSAEGARGPVGPAIVPPIPELAPDISQLNAIIGDLQETLPLHELGTSLLPFILFFGGLVLFLLLVRALLNTYVVEGKLTGRLRAGESGYPFLAAHLLAVAPPAERPRLARLAWRARTAAAFDRFLSAFAASPRGKP